MTQKERMKLFFEFRPNSWIPLYEILDMQPRIAKYSARISELRAEGMTIENRWKIVDGVKRSWFKYKPCNTILNGDQVEFCLDR